MEHQCTAMAKSTGKRCRCPAIPGGTVCRFHGGAASQVKRKAAERLREARDLSLLKFVEYLTGGKVDPKTTLEASLKLTELTETLAGRVARREEVRHDCSERTDEDLIREAEDILCAAAHDRPT